MRFHQIYINLWHTDDSWVFMTLNIFGLWIMMMKSKRGKPRQKDRGVSPRARAGNVLAKVPTSVCSPGSNYNSCSRLKVEGSKGSKRQDTKEGTTEFTTLFHTDGNLADGRTGLCRWALKPEPSGTAAPADVVSLALVGHLRFFFLGWFSFDRKNQKDIYIYMILWLYYIYDHTCNIV